MLAILERTERVEGSMAPRLRELLLGARVLCRAGGPAPHGDAAPSLELFVRTGRHNLLVSVNHCIIVEYDYLHQ